MIKNICINRKAHFNYNILDTLEAGVVLLGSEIKSIRSGFVNITDSFGYIKNNEVFARNIYIKTYDKAPADTILDERRDRKLLLNKQEIKKLNNKILQKGLTLIPIKMYFKDTHIKIELAVALGKHTYDKKQALKEKDIKMEATRSIKDNCY